ncbi:hypothetical protein AGDE_01365 [Angomonas deanei]|uniref:Methyltransferase domain containing protein n=1 Tax=Angomonas deanei TaxID=59799 RepID=S9VNR3_9TRYP|nr:hypothetical protein AGDE_11537 [Angomonas deanei]EPY35409.1 hypothetical protein AGDE_07375 [Angomonas deanei]EPY42558.1 hypothetical protein AGDE_01365 [Angomonas deanei]CAD2216507.1 hypothetical protein, conserved [Angomonas deanei]|eukprot:EPY26107.1 hypothetical protein AGDE_11537 [Angomonas deanei]
MIGSDELTPGTKAFWDHFYDDNDGRLVQKQAQSSQRSETVSILDQYEWFMNYEKYDKYVAECLDRLAHLSIDTLRVLHPGCGNSDFCEGFFETVKRWRKKQRCEVLNMDICESIIDRLSGEFPSRIYAKGDCCHFVAEGVEAQHGWWFAVHPETKVLLGVEPSSAHMVFDKGTMDALLSAFPGDYNPNSAAYVEEVLRAICVGGIFFIISINAEDVLNQYILSASSGSKSFRLTSKYEIRITEKEQHLLLVETLGSHYNVFVYHCVNE